MRIERCGKGLTVGGSHLRSAGAHGRSETARGPESEGLQGDEVGGWYARWWVVGGI